MPLLNKEENSKCRYFVFALIIAFVILASVLINWLLGGVCFALHPTEFSTRGSRFFETDPCVGATKPCHVYLAMGKDISSQMIIHYHMGVNMNDTYVYYDTTLPSNISQYQFKLSPKINYMKVLELFTLRFVYYAVLENLTPNTLYYFTIVRNNEVIDSKPYRTFLTGPNDDSPLHFVVGGDLGMDPGHEVILQQSANSDPLFAALGGDLTYANGIPSCYRRWDRWFDTWEKVMITPGGRTIPMIAAIGNHEAGGVNKKMSDVPFFTNYLIHEDTKEGQSPHDLPTNRNHSIGSQMALITLDSYITTTPESQISWMEEVFSDLKNRNISNIFAIYHVGLYPSKRDPSTEPHVSLRRAWGPVFDKYLKIAFENHDHTYKRTKLLKDGKETTDGTGVLYLGDGSFGVHDTGVQMYDYLAKSDAKLFFFDVHFNRTDLKITAVDQNGEIFDTISVN